MRRFGSSVSSFSSFKSFHVFSDLLSRPPMIVIQVNENVQQVVVLHRLASALRTVKQFLALNERVKKTKALAPVDHCIVAQRRARKTHLIDAADHARASVAARRAGEVRTKRLRT